MKLGRWIIALILILIIAIAGLMIRLPGQNRVLPTLYPTVEHIPTALTSDEARGTLQAGVEISYEIIRASGDSIVATLKAPFSPDYFLCTGNDKWWSGLSWIVNHPCPSHQ